MGHAARLCLAAGVLGLVLCVLNQWTAPALTPALERAGVLSSLLAVGLMLVAILWTRAVPIAPDRVALEGEEGYSCCRRCPRRWWRNWAGVARCCSRPLQPPHCCCIGVVSRCSVGGSGRDRLHARGHLRTGLDDGSGDRAGEPQALSRPR